MATDGSQQLQGKPISPGTEEKKNILLQALRLGKAHLEQDSEGKIQIVYEGEKSIPLSHVDLSKAHTVQEGKTPSDVRTRVDVCLEMIEAIKQNRAPSGVAIDSSKAKPSPLGRYAEGGQFTRLSEVLGNGNCAGDIVVVKDNKTDAEQAMKTVMISAFSADEVRAWVDLGESESFPSLYLFRLEGNQVIFHMEKLENAVTMDDIINEHMHTLRQQEPDLVRPFSLCVFHSLLSVVKEMHDKNWAHRDLHGGNVMLTQDSMTLKVLDFGMARKLRQDLDFNHDALRNDILNTIRLFCGLYIGQDFENNFVLEKEIKRGTLGQLLLETSGLSEEDRKELMQLIMMAYQVTQNPQQAGYGDTSSVMHNIEDKVLPDRIRDLMKKVAAVLFPKFYAGDRGLHDQGEAEVVDGAAGEQLEEEEVDTSGFDLDAAAAAIPDDFLKNMRIAL